MPKHQTTMRIKLTLNHLPNSTLPINYSYLLSSMIYKMLEKANPEFSKWLHEQGWGHDGKRYKLFTFGQLSPTYFRIKGDRIILVESPTYLTISFMMDEALGHFIEGLFNAQKFSLGDSKSHVDFEVSSVDILPKISFSERMKFTLKTPLVISHQGPNDRYAQYLHPVHDQPQYSQLFFANLLKKYIAYNGGLHNDIDLRPNDSHLKVLTKPSSKLISIKSETQQASKIRGYTYGFEVTGTPELIKMGYYAGFGEKGSMGFGYADLWTD